MALRDEDALENKLLPEPEKREISADGSALWKSWGGQSFPDGSSTSSKGGILFDARQ
jgi:hypothetical protein